MDSEYYTINELGRQLNIDYNIIMIACQNLGVPIVIVTNSGNRDVRAVTAEGASELTEYFSSQSEKNDRLLVYNHKALIRRGRYLALSDTVRGTGEDGFWSCQDCMSLDGERFILFDGYIESKDLVFISDEQYDSLLMAAQKLAKHKQLVEASAESVFRANVNTPACIVRQSKMNKQTCL